MSNNYTTPHNEAVDFRQISRNRHPRLPPLQEWRGSVGRWMIETYMVRFALQERGKGEVSERWGSMAAISIILTKMSVGEQISPQMRNTHEGGGVALTEAVAQPDVGGTAGCGWH
jgi:hypothetical protein